MPNVVARKSINAPIQTVWSLLDDFENIDKFHPGVKKSYLLSHQDTGVGAKRQCDFHSGASAQEEIVDYKPEQHSLTVRIPKFGPMKSFIAKESARDLGNGKTEVTFTADFIVKFGLLGALFGNLIIKPVMTKKMQEVIDGLESYATKPR
ncbi:SRPBCC family protein [Thalassomonas sp. RHCl1]|uniref:SRPBCC family protein n=1 Tax=Thalassomonas sp. RHCl1 TaxID=2995320 RepID=UPI00248D0D17|nr:SRPBCC family protein [Thalassomonas sp. RHCl1]